MNVDVPFANNPVAFAGIISATIGISALIIYIFKKTGWL